MLVKSGIRFTDALIQDVAQGGHGKPLDSILRHGGWGSGQRSVLSSQYSVLSAQCRALILIARPMRSRKAKNSVTEYRVLGTEYWSSAT
jgi:hypothetical protein